jgi:hypothetical protein
MKMREGITTTDARGRSIKQSLVKRAYLRLVSTNWPETGMGEITAAKSASIRQPHWHRHLIS